MDDDKDQQPPSDDGQTGGNNSPASESPAPEERPIQTEWVKKSQDPPEVRTTGGTKAPEDPDNG
jgi:hypothetical protein